MDDLREDVVYDLAVDVCEAEVSAGMARQFLDALSGRGGNAGNGILRQSLGWTEAEYEETKKILTIASHIKPGKVGSVIFI